MQHHSAANFQLSTFNFQLFSTIFAPNYETIPTYIYILLVIVGQLAIQAQVNPNNPYDDRIDEFGNIVDQYGNQIDPAMRPQNPDSSNVEIQGLPPKLYMWHISENLGTVTRTPADTLRLNFQNTNLTVRNDRAL